MAITINADTTNGAVITSDTSGILKLQTAGTDAVTIDAGQRTTFPTTIGVGSATPASSGSGITFPATQSASTDANTLDDYEEGTWTPVMTPDVGSITTQSGSGRYTKVGDMILLTGNITVSNWGTASGTPNINLPFTNADKFNAVGDESAVNGKCVVGRQASTGASSFAFIYYDNSSPANTGGAGATFIFSATYRTT